MTGRLFLFAVASLLIAIPVHAEPPANIDAAYAAGWTISGLATLGTIIAVWMFAI